MVFLHPARDIVTTSWPLAIICRSAAAGVLAVVGSVIRAVQAMTMRTTTNCQRLLMRAPPHGRIEMGRRRILSKAGSPCGSARRVDGGYTFNDPASQQAGAPARSRRLMPRHARSRGAVGTAPGDGRDLGGSGA